MSTDDKITVGVVMGALGLVFFALCILLVLAVKCNPNESDDCYEHCFENIPSDSTPAECRQACNP